jgi:hypothetical protein
MLCGDRNLVRLLDAWRRSTVHLRGTKAGQHCELERIQAAWTIHHDDPLFRVNE